MTISSIFQGEKDSPRRIIHVDMDAFYASVEEMDNPSLKGRPVVVGGSPQSRGVVSAANYIAREFGIRSAMPTYLAYKKCPNAVFLFPRFDRYKEISNGIRKIFLSHSKIIEPLALDEAWLDVTEVCAHRDLPATEIALSIKAAIRDKYDLTCSAGVSYNKMLAKIASKINKPDGLYVIRPGRGAKFLSDKPVSIIPFVGEKTVLRLEKLGIKTCADILNFGLENLISEFGKPGSHYFHSAMGQNNSPVSSHGLPKSISSETTFQRDQLWSEELRSALDKTSENVFRRYVRTRLESRSLTVKIKFHDFKQITRTVRLATSPKDATIIAQLAKDRIRQLMKSDFPGKSVRLVGIGLDNLAPLATQNIQPYLPGFEP